MILQQHKPETGWDDCQIGERETTPAAVKEALRECGAEGQYRLIYVKAGHLWSQRFTIQPRTTHDIDEVPARAIAPDLAGTESGESGSEVLEAGRGDESNAPITSLRRDGDVH